MIIIDNSIITSMKNRPCISEMISFPDAGSTSVCIKLSSELIEENSTAAIFFSEFNTPNTKYINKLIPKNKTQQILTIKYNIDDPFYIPNVIEKLAPYVKYFAIDDFYNFILYKNYTFIREFMKRLRSLKEIYGVSIILVNQFRNVIKTNKYNFDTNDEIKSLYYEHLESFLDIRIGISKDESSNIYVNLIEEKKEEETTALEKLISNLR